MKKLLISLLFLFPLITHSATAQVSSPVSYKIKYDYVTTTGELPDDIKTKLLDRDEFRLGDFLIQYQSFFPVSEYKKNEEGYLFIPAIDTNSEDIIGFIICNTEDRDSIKIECITTLKQYEKKGIGTSLINYLLTELKPKKITLKSVQEAVGFYTKLGFTEEPKGSKNFYKENPYLTEQS